MESQRPLELAAVPAHAAHGPEFHALALDDPEASVAHEPRVLAALGRAFRHRAELLVARHHGHLVGALPLIHVRGPFGATDSSVAYLDRGGPIGTLDARAALVRFAVGRTLARGATLELRSPEPLDEDVAGARVHVSREKDTLVCEVPARREDVAERLDAKTRNQLRKALREGLRAETLPASVERVRAFHEVYARTMRDLGSPPHALDLFLGLARALGERVRIARVHDERARVVAAAFLLDDLHGRTLLPWAASDRRADALEPNTLLYHELLADSVARGRRELDLGRSTREGPAFRFKVRWGAVPRPLYWATFAPPRARGALSGADRSGGGVGLAVEAWKRLPLPLARILGPFVGRWIAA